MGKSKYLTFTISTITLFVMLDAKSEYVRCLTLVMLNPDIPYLCTQC